MSYDQLSTLESGRQPGGYTDDPDFQTLQYELKNKLQKLLTSNRELSKGVGSLGTKKDNPRLRERVNKGLESTRELCREIGQGVKRLQTWDDLTVSFGHQGLHAFPCGSLLRSCRESGVLEGC